VEEPTEQIASSNRCGDAAGIIVGRDGGDRIRRSQANRAMCAMLV
jgi:hypothetical protein